MNRIAHRKHSSIDFFALLILLFGLHLATVAPAFAAPTAALPGLQHPARVVWDSDGIPHIYARTDRDAIYLQGYIHAQDRLYWMDWFRHTFDGTLAELLGESALGSDLQFRKFNLQAVARQSFEAVPKDIQRLLEAYAAGVNAYLATQPTPQEYALLEIDTIRPWLPTDPILLLKGIPALFWTELGDIKRTVDLAEFNARGTVGGFDGSALFFEDVYRVAPVLPAVVLPGFLESIGGTEAVATPMASPEKNRVADPGHRSSATAALDPQVLQLAQDYWSEMASSEIFENARKNIREGLGSNWWLISGALSETGNAMLASDPHQPVTMPTALHPVHIVSAEAGGLDVQGTNFGGVPGVMPGCNRYACWAPTNSNIDGGDIFQEELVFDATTGAPTHTFFQGNPESLIRLPQQYRFNNPGDGIVDNLSLAAVPPLDGDVFLVPRRAHGPLLTFTQTTGSGGVGLSSQYVGWAVGRDAEAFLRLGFIRNVDDFMEAVSLFDNFNLHVGYADRQGHIAYAVGGDAPLREDLQQMGGVDGQPPILIRDGRGVLAHEWLKNVSFGDSGVPYQILPQAEMPHSIDPPEGFIVTANNDPIGTTVDNDVFDQFRPDGGVLYLHYSYRGLRAARIQSEIARLTADGGKLSMVELKAMQANNQMMDAEVILPSLLEAFRNAQVPGAPAILAALAADPRVQEAIGRLVEWDYSTPTGIERGYDPGDDPDNLQAPGEEEIANSVAATLYSAWRGQAVRKVVDGTLTRIGLGGSLPDSENAFRAFANQILTFDAQSIGASGVDFFALDGLGDRRAARDAVLLESLQSALDLLAGDAFAAAFGNSTDQNDYRWGLLHRITIPHVLSPAFNVPSAGGFQDLEPTLPGLARGGGLETVDSASHDARAADANSFKFSVTPGYRMVVELTRRGPRGEQISPGGAGGDPFGPRYTNQLGRWLTHQYAPMRRTPGEVFRDAESRQTFVPQR